MKEDCANFSFIWGEFLEDGSYFILYKSQSHAVLLEIQPKVTNKSMKYSVEKCLEVIDRFDIQPLLVILTDKVSSPMRLMLSPSLEKPHWQILSSTIWAEKCLIFSKDSISLSEDETSNLDPLMIFTFYFFGDKAERQKLRSFNNSMMKAIDSFYGNKQ